MSEIVLCQRCAARIEVPDGQPASAVRCSKCGHTTLVGERHGEERGNLHQLVARPGYAVGAVRVWTGLVVNSIQLTFYRVGDGRLLAADHYTSDWIGVEGGAPTYLDAAGKPLIGITGSYEGDLNSLGIIRLD